MSQPFRTAVNADDDDDTDIKIVETGAISSDSIREQRASPRSLGSLQVSAIKPEQSDQTSQLISNSQRIDDTCHLIKKPQPMKI